MCNELRTESPAQERYRQQRRRRALGIRLARYGILVGFLLLWEVLARVGAIDPFLLSSPSRMVATIGELIRTGEMWLHLGTTLWETVVGFVLGSLLGIKPVLHVDDEGHLILMSKVRGRDASLKALVGKMKETALSNVRDQMVFISHGDAKEDAEKTAQYVKDQLGVQKVMIHNIGTVIGSHSGPGTLALFFLGSHR